MLGLLLEVLHRPASEAVPFGWPNLEEGLCNLLKIQPSNALSSPPPALTLAYMKN